MTLTLVDLAAIAGILFPLLAVATTVTLVLTGHAEARQEKRFDRLDADIREIRALLMPSVPFVRQVFKADAPSSAESKKD